MARYTKADAVTVPQLNTELEKIEQAIQDTLSRKGDTPNAMEGALDMNSNRVINVPDAVNAQEPLTFGQYLLSKEESAALKDAVFVDSIKDLASVNTAANNNVFVRGFYTGTDVGGGLFYWDSTKDKTDHNGGTVLDPARITAWDGTQADLSTLFTAAGSGTGCFVKISNKQTLSDFGASEGVDISLSLTQAKNTFPYGSTIDIDSNEYISSNGYLDFCTLSGGNRARITADTGADFALQLGRKTPNWDFYTITGITFDGNLKASDGVVFEDDTVGTENLSGRWCFNGSNFTDCDKGIFQKLGNIGNRYTNCNFVRNNFGAYHQDSDIGLMHSGSVIYQGCEFNSNALSAIYINDTTEGVGQFQFIANIIEGNQGFGVFCKLTKKALYSGIVFDNCWFELNAQSTSVTIDGVSYTPRDMYFEDTPLVVCKDMYLKDIQMVNSTMIAQRCRIDNSSGALNLILDDNSSIIAYDVFSQNNTSGVPFVYSISGNYSETSVTRTATWRGPLKTSKIPTHANTVYREYFDGSGPFLFTGTASVNATSVSDGVIHNTCAELTIPTGFTLLSSAKGTATAGKFAVFAVHAKLISGSIATADLGGGGDRFGFLHLREGEWTCSYGYAKVRATPTESRLRFINSSGADAVIRIADMFVVEFDTEQEALEFVNSRSIPK